MVSPFAEVPAGVVRGHLRHPLVCTQRAEVDEIVGERHLAE